MSDKTSQAGGGHAHIGLMLYQGDNWPEEYRNRMYTLNLHGSRINCNYLERQAAGYVGKRGPDFCFWSDPWFRGMDLITGQTIGVDGGLHYLRKYEDRQCNFDTKLSLKQPWKKYLRFMRAPDALKQLLPPWENMRIVESRGSLRVGSRVVLAGKLLVVSHEDLQLL